MLYLHDNLGGIGSPNLAAPQATLMATIIQGLLNQNLPWGLVLVGVFVAVMLELCGIQSLSFAVGSYLPIATTAPIFCGGLVRWWVERKTGQSQESDVSSGTLFSSGLIAGGSIAGILFALLVGTNDWAKETLGIRHHRRTPGARRDGSPISVRRRRSARSRSLALFAALAVIVARVGLRKVE